MQIFSCLIVEDEPLAAEVLEEYIGQTPFLQLKAKCPDAIYALDILHQEPVDLIFLDIHLPKLKGLDFIRTLKNPPPIIITTAYQEYALQGYECNVLDYLLKPIEYNRFLMAVNKLNVVTGRSSSDRPAPAAPAKDHLFFTVSKKKIRVQLEEILYIESLKEYIRITTPNKSILTKMQLGQVEELLAKNDFLRIHRSFIIAKNKIDAFSATDVEINGRQIPIGRNYKDSVMMALE